MGVLRIEVHDVDNGNTRVDDVSNGSATVLTLTLTRYSTTTWSEPLPPGPP